MKFPCGDDDDDVDIGNWANIIHAITITSGYGLGRDLSR